MLTRRAFAATAAAAALTLAAATSTSSARVHAAAASAQPAAPLHHQHQSSLSIPSLPSSSSTASLFSHATTQALEARPAAPAPRCPSLFPHAHSSACAMQLSAAEGATAAMASVADGESMTEAQATKCDEWKNKAIHQSRKVNFMFRALKRAGCVVDPLTFIHCTACDAHMNGALFHDANGHTATLMCGNRLTSFKQFETVLTHELLHAFDHCRAEIDPFNLRHHACMEVRAASLSGDCEFKREAKLGNLNLTKQHPVCVRRRAVISVMSNVACADSAEAKAAVDDIFDRCYSDKEPFGAIP